MLPSPCEDAILANARARGSKSRHLSVQQPPDNPRSFFVIGEKQFKNPRLFPPPATEGLDQPRTIVFSRSDDPIEQTIRVLGNNVTSGYTSDTLKVIAVINWLWQKDGCDPEGWVCAPYAKVIRRLELPPSNASRNRRHVKEELERLRRCVLVFSQFQSGGDIKDNHEITYFSEYFYQEDQRNPSNNFFRARLDPFVLANLRSGYISTLPLEALLELKHDNSKPILLRVDSVLAVQERLELSSDSIFDLLSINGNTEWFRKRNTRAKLLGQISNDINGKTLSSGWKVIAELDDTASKDDFKIRFTRGEKINIPITAQPLPIVNTDPVLVQQLVNNMIALVGASENVEIFTVYAKFYSEEIIHRAIAEFKSDKPASTRNLGAYFTKILSRIVQEQGFRWVK